MASIKDNPVLAELDSIAMELEKTGNADLATLVDECSAELLSAPQKKASTKKPKRRKQRRSKKNRKSAGASRTRKRQRIAQAMRKIARAQVSELEDIAAELLNEGEKTAALEVLKIAQDLDSDYDYSKQGDHDEPEHKGDADKRYERKENLPAPKGDDPQMEYPYEEGEGYPFNEGEKSAFATQLDELIRLAEEDSGEEMPPMDDMGDEDPMADEEDDEAEDDMGDMEEDEADDELAAMMDAMGMGDDHEAADRMYGAEDDMGEDADDLDLGALDMGDEDEDPMGDEEDMGEEEEEGDDLALDDMDMGDEEDDDPMMDEPEDAEAGLGGAALGAGLGALGGPLGMAAGGALGALASADKKKVARLAKKLWNNGQKDLARRVASLAKSK